MEPSVTRRVLVLDDSPTILAQVEALLSPRFSVYVTTEWVEANALMHRLDPAALVIDWNLAGFEGTYLIRAFRRFFGDELPIVMLSGEADAAEVAREAGASAFVPKRDMDHLAAALEATFEAHRAGPVDDLVDWRRQARPTS